MPIGKLLIANRGEIALRILRSCREMGIATVAVYSTVDKNALHVQLADEAVCVGDSPSSKSYLNVPNILAAATSRGVDAIHPGYGFLAENDRFAEICGDHGLIFVGPSPHAIRSMGDKSTAKSTMQKVGVPTVPGSEGLLDSVSDASKLASEMGYPVMIKATAGGGGRGMRVVQEESELISSLQLTKQEAKNAFGNDTIYFEKFIQNPRHIEVQIVADGQGNAIHLGTRDCSMQRRHQKIIEEAPAKNIDKNALEQTYEASINLCKQLKYEGAGTIEFLYEDGEFYFIEMNTRIQVEHPVTEMITGFDIVKAQLRIALGMDIKLDQESINFFGHAMECRINAEDPVTFQPSPGKITKMHIPGGFGIRYDSHIYGGYTVPPYYDSLLAKIITLANTRNSAIKRMISALDEFFIDGIKTNHSLHQRILHDETFVANKHTINYLENEFLKNDS